MKLPTKAGLIGVEEIARAFPDIPRRAVEIAIKNGTLPTKGGKFTLTDFQKWKARRPV
jgi:hypothetical protein